MRTWIGIILISLYVFSAENASSQIVRIGIKAGGNGSWLRGDKNQDEIFKELKAGLHYGAYTTLHFAGFLALQPEILVSAKGNNFFDGNKDLKLDIRYVDVPLLLQVWPTEKFSVYFGPQAGITYRAKLEDKNGGTKTSFMDKIRITDFGFIAGVAVELESGLRFFARYNHGLVDISDDQVRVMQNSVIQTGIGFTFIKIGD